MAGRSMMSAASASMNSTAGSTIWGGKTTPIMISLRDMRVKAIALNKAYHRAWLAINMKEPEDRAEDGPDVDEHD